MSSLKKSSLPSDESRNSKRRRRHDEDDEHEAMKKSSRYESKHSKKHRRHDECDEREARKSNSTRHESSSKRRHDDVEHEAAKKTTPKRRKNDDQNDHEAKKPTTRRKYQDDVIKDEVKELEPTPQPVKTSADVQKIIADAQNLLKQRIIQMSSLPPVILPQLPRKNVIGMTTQQIPLSVISSRPTPLILNEEGKTVDVSGKEIQLSKREPTLKANIRAKFKEHYKLNDNNNVRVKKEEDVSIEKKSYYDPRVEEKEVERPKRVFKFHEKGKFEQIAQRHRTKLQLEKLQQEISEAAKKTGISSTTKLALIAPKTTFLDDEIPTDAEWWDNVILGYTGNLDVIDDKNLTDAEKFPGLTNLIEHPREMRPPSEPTKPIRQPVFLTSKEKKKMRRMNRRETLKEKQEKIRLGLEPPPAPKLKIANMMRVLGQDAVMDPTKIEARVRAQIAKRKEVHEATNASRKLTDEEKREKKIKKIKEDVSLGVFVAVYRVNDLRNPSKKFKVETNCNQLHMSGFVLLYSDCNVVVVEGGPKQQKKFKRLMMSRIKWGEDNIGEGVVNKCVLVWEGSVKYRCFGNMKFKVCPTENQARAYFKKHGVEHYWDLAYSGAILELAD
uniref:Uncharacterized protein n=1 Tax=Strigamia maritima TaxID=126957 RepID=T1IKN5_STRMM